ARDKSISLRNFEPNVAEPGFVGEVIFRDGFGNLITNVNADRLAEAAAASWIIEMGGERIEGIVRTYGDRPAGSLIALFGSSGWAGIAVVHGGAGRQPTPHSG